MKEIIRYLLYMIPFVLISIILFIIIRFIYYKVSKKKFDLKRELLFMLLVILITCIISLALLPIYKGVHKNNIIPFKILFDTYDQVINHDNINYFTISLMANILLFVPIGILIPMIWKIKDRYVILIGFCLSLFIELNQLYLPRTTDIDDLILNTIGVIIGIYIYKLIDKMSKK